MNVICAEETMNGVRVAPDDQLVQNITTLRALSVLQSAGSPQQVHPPPLAVRLRSVRAARIEELLAWSPSLVRQSWHSAVVR